MSNGAVFWRTLGVVFGILELLGTLSGDLGGSLGTFLVSGQLLGPLFQILEAPWGTFWHRMGPRTDFFGFWWLLGSILGGFWEPGWGLGGHLGAFWYHLGF